jgi:hypothetical protein
MKGAVYAACVLSTKEAGEEGESPVTVRNNDNLPFLSGLLDGRPAALCPSVPLSLGFLGFLGFLCPSGSCCSLSCVPGAQQHILPFLSGWMDGPAAALGFLLFFVLAVSGSLAACLVAARLPAVLRPLCSTETGRRNRCCLSGRDREAQCLRPPDGEHRGNRIEGRRRGTGTGGRTEERGRGVLKGAVA